MEKQTIRNKNLVAIIDEDITTLSASYEAPDKVAPDGFGLSTFDTVGPKHYTFKVPKKLAKTLAVGDPVICQTRKTLNVVYVTAVHAETMIVPGSDIDYKWVFGKVKPNALSELLEREAAMMTKVRETQQRQVRRQAREMLGLNEPAALGDFSTPDRYKRPEVDAFDDGDTGPDVEGFVEELD